MCIFQLILHLNTFIALIGNKYTGSPKSLFILVLLHNDIILPTPIDMDGKLG